MHMDLYTDLCAHIASDFSAKGQNQRELLLQEAFGVLMPRTKDSHTHTHSSTDVQTIHNGKTNRFMDKRKLYVNYCFSVWIWHHFFLFVHLLFVMLLSLIVQKESDIAMWNKLRYIFYGFNKENKYRALLNSRLNWWICSEILVQRTIDETTYLSISMCLQTTYITSLNKLII